MSAHTKLVSAIALAAILLAITCDDVGATSRSSLADAKKTLALGKRANEIALDIGQIVSSWTDSILADRNAVEANQAEKTIICLGFLRDTASELSAKMREDTAVLMILSGLKHADDEVEAIQVAKLSFAGTIEGLPIYRKQANDMSTGCNNSAVVNTKAQAILDLIGEVDVTVKPIAWRLGVERP